jgi:hypothetical protein
MRSQWVEDDFADIVMGAVVSMMIYLSPALRPMD